MDQKGFANIILVAVIVVLLGAVGYFAFIKKSEPITQQPTPTPTQAIDTPTPTANPTPAPQPPNQPTPSAHTNYKKMVSESFDYGNGEQQFGVTRGSGPLSFSTDSKNYLYIIDSNNSRVKILDSNGKQVSMFNTKESLGDIAVDNNDNVYGHRGSLGYSRDLLKYNNSGSLLGKIEETPAFSEILSNKISQGHLYISGDKLYITDGDQNSYLISSTVGNLKSESPAKIDGIYGLSGKRYKVYYKNGGMIDIINQAGIAEKTIIAEIAGLLSIRFLGEDQNGNFYIQAELRGGADVKLQVRKYNPSGNLLTTLDIPNNKYAFWTVKLLHVDRTGDIWQVVPVGNKLFVNRWSTIY